MQAAVAMPAAIPIVPEVVSLAQLATRQVAAAKVAILLTLNRTAQQAQQAQQDNRHPPARAERSALATARVAALGRSASSVLSSQQQGPQRAILDAPRAQQGKRPPNRIR